MSSPILNPTALLGSRLSLFLLVLGLAPAAMAANPKPFTERLAKCPNTPNCVSSKHGEPGERMEPIPFRLPLAEAREVLFQTLNVMGRMEVVEDFDTYLRVEATTAIFHFVDDVELMFDLEAQVIHFRSASRTGYSDLGTNRRRMEKIRREYTKREDSAFD
jgi:uncharacterized protein (DUF1499 family)